MLSRVLKQTARLINCRPFSSNTPWKNMDYYYNYDFNNKMDFIDYKKRYPLFRVLDLEGNVLAPEYENLDKKTCEEGLNIMTLSRMMDEVFNNAQRQGRITYYMTGIYEEAASLGAVLALKFEDAIFSQYRDSTLLIKRGFKSMDFLNNLKGNRDDFALGKCMQLTCLHEKMNLFPNSAPLGNRNPHAAGAGYVFRTSNLDRVAFCSFGEGAASEGDFHSAMNFAATLGSQTLFMCRNNGYCISTFRFDEYAGDGVAPRGIGYGVPALKVDGHDLFAVYNATKKAREMVIERKGPVLVEVYTYRGGDHTTADSADRYRTPDVMKTVDVYIKQIGDPIVRLAKYMQKKGYIKSHEETVKTLMNQYREQCMQNLRDLDHIPMAYHNTMFEGVYKDMPWNLKEQMESFNEHLKKYPKMYPLSEFPKN